MACKPQEIVFNTERNIHRRNLLKLEYTQQRLETSLVVTSLHRKRTRAITLKVFQHVWFMYIIVPVHTYKVQRYLHWRQVFWWCLDWGNNVGRRHLHPTGALCRPTRMHCHSYLNRSWTNSGPLLFHQTIASHLQWWRHWLQPMLMLYLKVHLL